MKEIPILMSTPNIQPILAERKTETRRIIKPQPFLNRAFSSEEPKCKEWFSINGSHNDSPEKWIKFCPYGSVGDVLWVKEMHYAYGMWLKNGLSKSGKQKWWFVDTTITGFEYRYFDNPPENVLRNTVRETYGWFKRSSLFMPKSACRIRLEVTDISVERLHDITEEGARAEGVTNADSFKGIGVDESMANRYAYRELWESINGKGSWIKNDWVWVIKFIKL